MAWPININISNDFNNNTQNNNYKSNLHISFYSLLHSYSSQMGVRINIPGGREELMKTLSLNTKF